MGKYGKLRAMFYFGKLRDLSSSPPKKTNREREREKDREKSREAKMGVEAVRGTERMEGSDIKHSKEIDTERDAEIDKAPKMGTDTVRCTGTETIGNKDVRQLNSSSSHDISGLATLNLTQVEIESNHVQALSLEYCQSHPLHQPPSYIRLSRSSSLSTSKMDLNSYNKMYDDRDFHSGGGSYFHDQCNRRQKMLDNDEIAINRKKSFISANSFSKS